MLNHYYPHLGVELAVRPDAQPLLSGDEQKKIVFLAGHQKGRLTFIKAARRSRYHTVAVLFAGDAGFGAMKVVAFLCGGRRLLCCNENGDAFEWRWSNWRTVIRHVTWRLNVGRRRQRWSDVPLFILRFLGAPIFSAAGAVILLSRTCTLLVRARVARLVSANAAGARYVDGA
jgi:hypothetical protein